MLHEKPDRSDGADACSGEWTGEKRRKHLDPCPHTSSDSPPAKMGQDEDPFFTPEDEVDFTVILDELAHITNLKRDRPFIFVSLRCMLDDEPQRRVYERLILYRLRAHKLSKGESMDKLDDEALRNELPDFLVKEKHTPQLHFDVKNYFTCLEKDEPVSVDWYFDPEFSKLKDLGNYQRLVLKKHDDVEYFDWEGYRSTFTTYKMDEDYVLFFTEMSRKLQWLKKYIGTRGSQQWEMKTQFIGARQALKISERFPDVTVDLAYTAYNEYIWSLHYDYLYCEGWDTIFFEIWNLVTSEKMKFTRALMKVKERRLFPQHDAAMLRFLNNRRLFDLESKFDYCVQDIPLGAADVVAKDKIKKAVSKLPRKKMLHQYMERKMLIAEKIGLNEDCSKPRMLPWDEPEDHLRSTCIM